MMRDGKRRLSCLGKRHSGGSFGVGMVECCAPFDTICGSSKEFIGRTNGAGKGCVLFNPRCLFSFCFLTTQKRR